MTVTAVDTAAHIVRHSGGTETYDRLLIATGAESAVPPIGALRTAGNVYGLRHLTDAKAIWERALKSKKVLVVGAGLVGLDAAYALAEIGLKPVVVEMAKSILALNLDAHAAAEYQRRFEEAGCTFHLGRKVMDTVCDPNGDITALALDTGEEIPCDMVIVAAGVRPATMFLRDSGIQFERAVTVDERLATSVEGVYAAGDVAGLSGIWPNATLQGEVAAKNMCGVPTVYSDQFAQKNTVNFFGLLALSVGRLNPEDGDEVIVREDRGRYQKFILRDGFVVGVVLLGDIGGGGFWQYLIKNGINVAAVDKPIWKLSYADFYGVEPDGEYRWATA